jgi:hypothetical protein
LDDVLRHAMLAEEKFMSGEVIFTKAGQYRVIFPIEGYIDLYHTLG